MKTSDDSQDTRPLHRIRAHYEIEKELASRLMNSTREERSRLYVSLYDELYQRVPDHPMLTGKSSHALRLADVRAQMNLLGRFLNPDTVFAEIGPGDCALAFHVSGWVHEVIAIDVSAEITKSTSIPRNVRIAISDGVSIPVPPSSLDLVYSNQLMEHLHPVDAIEQMQNILWALKPGGTYICLTPNRLTGPHDVSSHFEEIAAGFHLKEYTFGELARLMRHAGFHTIRSYIGGKGRFVTVPTAVLESLEKHYSAMDAARRRALRHRSLLRLLSTVRIAATRQR